MKLFILRHGEAEALKTTDRERELTEKGRSDIRKLAQSLAQKSLVFDHAFVSPFTRTQQTYAEMSAELSIRAMSLEESLVHSAPVNGVLPLLDPRFLNVLLVSHQPLVSTLVSYLVEGHEEAAYKYPMVPGSLSILDMHGQSKGAATFCTTLFPDH